MEDIVLLSWFRILEGPFELTLSPSRALNLTSHIAPRHASKTCHREVIVCRARTPSITNHANLDCVFVKK